LDLLAHRASGIRFSYLSLPTKLITGKYEILQAIIPEPTTKIPGLPLCSLEERQESKQFFKGIGSTGTEELARSFARWVSVECTPVWYQSVST
jgi:hypothetical protein